MVPGSFPNCDMNVELDLLNIGMSFGSSVTTVKARISIRASRRGSKLR